MSPHLPSEENNAPKLEPLAPPVAAGGGSLMWRALAGMETGVLGGLGVVVWQAFGSLSAGEAAWETAARLALGAFGSGVARGGPAAAAMAGAALQIFSGGVLGTLFGILMRGAWATRRVVWLGLLFGLGWYYVGYEILLFRFGFGSRAVAPRSSLLASHLLFGFFLATYPRFRRSLEAGSGEGA